jgi:hypothetical protein
MAAARFVVLEIAIGLAVTLVTYVVGPQDIVLALSVALIVCLVVWLGLIALERRKSRPAGEDTKAGIKAYATVRPSKAVQAMCAELADAIQREWDSDHTPPQFEDHRKRLREQIKPRVEAFHVWTRELESLSKKKYWDRTVALTAKSALRALVSPPEPIVVTPKPIAIHIDRTPGQMAQLLFNRNPLVRRVRKTWWRLKHGL